MYVCFNNYPHWGLVVPGLGIQSLAYVVQVVPAGFFSEVLGISGCLLSLSNAVKMKNPVCP